MSEGFCKILYLYNILIDRVKQFFFSEVSVREPKL